jgi:hypothetical protein
MPSFQMQHVMQHVIHKLQNVLQRESQHGIWPENQVGADER